jgi:hypothetical protein
MIKQPINSEPGDSIQPGTGNALSRFGQACQINFYAVREGSISNLQIIWQFRNRLKRFSKRRINYVLYFLKKFFRKEPESLSLPVISKPLDRPLQPGDRVRIRSRAEIEQTNNQWNELKGCGFMEEMWPYCGTEQVVMKRVERFLDESTYRMQKTRGLVLLQGLMCAGTIDFGRCDRSCFFFWREEWLERIE